MFRATSHSQSFLLDTLALMHHFLNMVDEHSRGKVITVRRKVGERTGNKKKRQRENNDSESEEQEEVQNAEYDSEDDDEANAYENRQFNFNSELSILVDYHVISLLCPLITHEVHSKNADTL